MTSRKRELYQAELLKERAKNEEREIEERGSGSPLFSIGVFYVQIPIPLLQDSSLTASAKLLYGIFHSFCQEKKLSKDPLTFVSPAKIGRDFMGGSSRQYVCNLTKDLERAGWLFSLRRGLGHSNIIILSDRKGKRLSEAQRREFKKIVASHFKKIEESA